MRRRGASPHPNPLLSSSSCVALRQTALSHAGRPPSGMDGAGRLCISQSCQLACSLTGRLHTLAPLSCSLLPLTYSSDRVNFALHRLVCGINQRGSHKHPLPHKSLRRQKANTQSTINHQGAKNHMPKSLLDILVPPVGVRARRQADDPSVRAFDGWNNVRFGRVPDPLRLSQVRLHVLFCLVHAAAVRRRGGFSPPA